MRCSGRLARKSIDGFVLSPPAGNQAEADGKGMILVNLMSGEIPKYRDMMFQAVATTPATISEKREYPDEIRSRRGARSKAHGIRQGQSTGTRREGISQHRPSCFQICFRCFLSVFLDGPGDSTAGVDKALESISSQGKPADKIVDNSIAKARTAVIRGCHLNIEA